MARARRRVVATALIAFASLSTAACAAIFGFEELGGENYKDGGPNVPETSTDGPIEAGDGFVPLPGCDKIGIPDKPPPGTDSGTEDDQEILVAIDTLDIGITTAAGYNLDRACSPTREFSTCIAGGKGTDFDEFGKDTDEAGTDNAAFALLRTVGAFGDGFKPTEINKRLREGDFGGVIRITKWNGTNDDGEVVVEVFPALGVSVNQGGGVYVRKTSKVDAGFAADDHWHRDTRFQGVNGVSKQFSLNAWISAGRVYARFAQLVIPVNVPDDAKPLDLTMNEAIISAQIVNESGNVRLTDGVVGGRVPTKDFLRDIRTIYILDNNGVKNAFLCTKGTLGPAVYGLVKDKVCVARDIVASGADDRTKGCDAFSAGFRINSYTLTDKSFYEGTTNFENLSPDATAPRCSVDPGIALGDDCDAAVP